MAPYQSKDEINHMLIHNSNKLRILLTAVVDIHRAAKRRGKFLPLPSENEGNNCFGIYETSWIK